MRARTVSKFLRKKPTKSNLKLNVTNVVIDRTVLGSAYECNRKRDSFKVALVNFVMLCIQSHDGWMVFQIQLLPEYKVEPGDRRTANKSEQKDHCIDPVQLVVVKTFTIQMPVSAIIRLRKLPNQAAKHQHP